MHGIKYFFLNKNNQTIQGGGAKKFPGGHVPKTLPKSTILPPLTVNDLFLILIKIYIL
jgi:hypothetical protein